MARLGKRMVQKGSRHLNHIHAMSQLYKGRKMRMWELQGQLTGCSPSIKLQSHNTGSTMQLLQALWALPVQHRLQSAPWNRQKGGYCRCWSSISETWNPHKDSFGLFPSFHEVSVEKALNISPRADSWLPACMCLESQHHQKRRKGLPHLNQWDSSVDIMHTLNGFPGSGLNAGNKN